MISMRQVRKQYADGTVAVHELDLDVGRGEVAVLIGPSGCGKTTTMRMINRLVDPSSGRIYLDGDDVTAADPVKLRRSMGYVIQQVGLFPHQTVSDNIATVPKLLGWDRRRTSARIGELLELVGLDPSRFAKRYPHELSGGQRQRVGVARALAADPPVLLMDEPFGAVDPIARDRLQAEFLRLQEQVRKTVVFVTHDMDEAVRLGDRVAVMREGGHLEQYAEPAALLTSPVNDFVADFVGARQTLRRLSVVRLGWDAAEPWPTVDADGDAAGADLRGATHAVVLDGDAPVGWLAASAATGSGVARERMRPAAVVDRAATVEQAMAQLLATGGPGVVVTDGGRYAGVVTATGLIDAAREPTPEGTADDE